MTHHIGPGPTDPILHVSFDVDQIGSRMLWNVDAGARDFLLRWGPHAGSLHFPDPPYSLWVQAKAYANPQTFVSVEVVDATLISVPRIYQPSTPVASPFELHSGCTRVPSMRVTETIGIEPISGRSLTRLQSTKPLTVATSSGGWMLSMVLTVTIRRNSPARPQETRVFTFDPEAEVGNGSRPTV